jgi:hypothetical protein
MPTETWEHEEHEGTSYRFLTMYAIHDDGWCLELTQVGDPARHLVTAIVPHEDPSLPVKVIFSEGEVPLPLLLRFLNEVTEEELAWGREPTTSDTASQCRTHGSSPEKQDNGPSGPS